MADLQVVPARHGVATFVPAGQTIKIINSSGTQVIDTWAFALPKPEPKAGSKIADEGPKQEGAEAPEPKTNPVKKTRKGGNVDLPSQEDAEKLTQEAKKQDGQDSKDSTQKSSWGSYVPTLGWSSSKKGQDGSNKQETEQQKDSRTWASYFPSGKGFSNYVPKAATDTVSGLAAMHQRDTNKSYVEQLQAFSRTPVGAAGWSGMAALTGSGYAGSMYAGYQAWNMHNADQHMTEFMSMPHTRTATLHLCPRVNDTLVSNMREPMLTLIEDSSPGSHDTLIAACDPQRYRQLGVSSWETHGSCAENLVLALKELNERAGLQGARAVGASMTVNSAPPPLNLFMNVPWDEHGDLNLLAPTSRSNDFVRLKAERDVVVVMSACPSDVTDVNGKNICDAHFIVEQGTESTRDALRRTAARQQRPGMQRSPPKKLGTSTTTRKKAADANVDDRAASQRQPITSKKIPPKANQVSAPAPPNVGSTPISKPSQPATRKKPIPQPVVPQHKKRKQSPPPRGAGMTTETPTLSTRKNPRKLTRQSTEA